MGYVGVWPRCCSLQIQLALISGSGNMYKRPGWKSSDDRRNSTLADQVERSVLCASAVTHSLRRPIRLSSEARARQARVDVVLLVPELSGPSTPKEPPEHFTEQHHHHHRRRPPRTSPITSPSQSQFYHNSGSILLCLPRNSISVRCFVCNPQILASKCQLVIEKRDGRRPARQGGTVQRIQAQATLESANWNLEEAVNLYFAASEDPQHDHDADLDPDESISAPSTSRPQPSSSSLPRAGVPTGRTNRPKQMSMRDLMGNNDDDDDHDDDKNQDMFAGGEKSGLAVQNPNQGPSDHFRNIMNQARQNRSRPNASDETAEESAPQRSSAFTGRAQTLGGDDAVSRVIDDPRSNAPRRSALPPVNRTLHLWADGVSIDDGPLFRFDDPANQDMMAQINQGRAPLSLLDVQPDQEVDLNLMPHKDENYVAPKKTYRPFEGQGQRLGSPTPGPAAVPSLSSSSSNIPATATSAPTTSSAPSTQQAQVTIDDSTPTLQLQIRLGDGTRLTSRFNTTHTIGDVYSFVDQAASTQRAYALMTTFPSRELTDKAAVLGEMNDYKRGGVVVQKWV
nr:ubx domain-containing protein 1 [Quercus suber]